MLSGDSDKRAPPPLLTSARKKQKKQMLEQQLVCPQSERKPLSLDASDETRWLVIHLFDSSRKEGSSGFKLVLARKGF